VLRNTITGPPIISSFTPTSGSIGTAVTIAGANFSSQQLIILLWFGAVQATVTAATTTQLTVTVTDRSNIIKPITVTINGLTDYSGSPFKVTFPTSQVIDATSLAAKLISQQDPIHTSLLLVISMEMVKLTRCHKPSSNTISIYRNISTSGSIVSRFIRGKSRFRHWNNPKWNSNW